MVSLRRTSRIISQVAVDVRVILGSARGVCSRSCLSRVFVGAGTVEVEQGFGLRNGLKTPKDSTITAAETTVGPSVYNMT
jgi:hypothetical protein